MKKPLIGLAVKMVQKLQLEGTDETSKAPMCYKERKREKESTCLPIF